MKISRKASKKLASRIPSIEAIEAERQRRDAEDFGDLPTDAEWLAERKWKREGIAMLMELRELGFELRRLKPRA